MKGNEVVLILSIESDRDLSETISSSGISATKTWRKGDLKLKGSILKYKNFGFSIEEKFYDIPSAGDLIKKFLADINVARSIKLQSVKKAAKSRDLQPRQLAGSILRYGLAKAISG